MQFQGLTNDLPSGGRPLRAANENAVPAGPRNGAKRHGERAAISERLYKAAARLDQLACLVAPDDDGRLPEIVVQAIELADAIGPDCDLEPALGWRDWPAFPGGPDPMRKSRKAREAYRLSHCLDLEREHDGREPEADTEPSLGWPIDFAAHWGGVDDAEVEPEMGPAHLWLDLPRLPSWRAQPRPASELFSTRKGRASLAVIEGGRA